MNTLQQRKQHHTFTLILLATILAISAVATLAIGSLPIAWTTIIDIVTSKLSGAVLPATISPLHSDIIWLIRLPRILLAIIAGASLALCGTIMQAAVQNPLAEPYLLGVSSGASLGAAVIILFGNTISLAGFGIAAGAFVGAAAAALFVLLLAGSGRSMSTVKIILAGTAANALAIALTNLLMYLSNNADSVRTITFWTMGSLAAAKWDTLSWPALGCLLFSAYFLTQSRSLNSLLLGEESAVALGIPLTKIRRTYILLCAGMTALIVSACGVFAFVGLLIPHAIRACVGADHSILTPASLLGGSIFLLWGDAFARTLLPGGELPIGVLTSLLGAPFFLFTLYRQTHSTR